MDRSLKPLDVVYGSSLGVDRQRVLRNTYALLALSMLPTVLGAWLGVSMGFSFLAGSPLMSVLVFMGISFAFFFGINQFKNSGVGVALLLGFTFFMGLMLSRILGFALNLSNGANLIMMAFGGTAIIFAGMATLAGTVKSDLSGMGKWLFAGMLLVLVAGIANIWLQMPALMLAISAMACAIFSAYILYDVKRIMDGGETNYVMATLSIYLNIYNVFTSLLQLLMALGGSDD